MTNARRNGSSGALPVLERRTQIDSNQLSPLGEKIFLDRYALKDGSKETLAVGDTVVVNVDPQSGQREIGEVTGLDGQKVTVRLRDGSSVDRPLEHVDKPIETSVEQLMDRVARGAAAVEAPEKRTEWQQNFRWLLEGWKFTPGGRILTACGTEQNLTFYNCLPPEQEVLTAQGYRPIGEVQVGDVVVTHRNRLRPVLHRFERDTREPLFVIRPKKVGYDALRVTGEHKVLAVRMESLHRHPSRDGWLKPGQGSEWVPASQLKPGDYVALACDRAVEPVAALRVSEYLSGKCGYQLENGKIRKPQVRKSHHGHLEAGGTHYDVTDEVAVDEELCYLFGRWLGDGCITHRTGTDIESGIKITFNTKERAEAERIAGIITRKFNVPASVKESRAGQWLDVWANSLALGQFFKAFLGCYSHGKRIPSLLIHLPESHVLALLKGIFGADGYTSANEIGILLANRTLATQIHQLLLRVGYVFSIRNNTHKNGRHNAYRVSAAVSEAAPLFGEFFAATPPEVGRSQTYHVEHEGLSWVRIDNIEMAEYEGPVIDLEVEEDHSFVSAGIVVSNCYVVPSPDDSRDGIFKTLKQMAEIMSRGGGVGINLSSLRPRYSYVRGVNGRSSGSVSWGALYSFVTGLIEQGGSRRGALMLILNVWHPDVLDFINAKREMGKISNANISVGITDDFMEAMKADREWELVFPDTADPLYGESSWTGNLEAWKARGGKVVVHKRVRAREIWNQIIESAWSSAEPGVWFVDRANKMSNSYYYPEGDLICTNPCGEQPLPAFAVCNLGHINLSRFVDQGEVAWDKLGRAVRVAARFLDNVIDATPYFFAENEKQQKCERRVGLGTIGLAEMLIRLELRYGSPESVQFIEDLYGFIAEQAYLASADNAQEKGSFPKFEVDKFLNSGFMQQMPEDIREAVREKGIRNVTLLTQAPTGTVGTMVGTSTGIEPFYFWSYLRKSRLGAHEEKVSVLEEWQEQNPDRELPDYFVNAMDLTPEEHVQVQAATQRWVDSAISKTCNCPAEYTLDQTRELYELMYRLGCKGGTIYRDRSRDEQVLSVKEAPEAKPTPPPKPAAPEPKVRPRPYKRYGATVSKDTPGGTAHVTMNDDEEGRPFEVFVDIGKGGSDIKAMAEALGRLVSLVLRVKSPLTPRERVYEMVNQLSGIGGPRSLGFGKNRVRSLPDALAQALEEQYLVSEPRPHPALQGTVPAQPPEAHENPARAKGIKQMADLCPSCGNTTLVSTEGCQSCYSCGHSEC